LEQFNNGRPTTIARGKLNEMLGVTQTGINNGG